MTEQNAIPETPLEVAVTLGRIEMGVQQLNEKVDRLSRQTESHETTLNRHEIALQVIAAREAAQRPKAPWWAVVAAVVGIIAAVGVLASIGVQLVEVLSMLENGRARLP